MRSRRRTVLLLYNSDLRQGREFDCIKASLDLGARPLIDFNAFLNYIQFIDIGGIFPRFTDVAQCSVASKMCLDHGAGSSVNSAICEEISKFCVRWSMRKYLEA